MGNFQSTNISKSGYVSDDPLSAQIISDYEQTLDDNSRNENLNSINDQTNKNFDELTEQLMADYPEEYAELKGGNLNILPKQQRYPGSSGPVGSPSTYTNFSSTYSKNPGTFNLKNDVLAAKSMSSSSPSASYMPTQQLSLAPQQTSFMPATKPASYMPTQQLSLAPQQTSFMPATKPASYMPTKQLSLAPQQRSFMPVAKPASYMPPQQLSMAPQQRSFMPATKPASYMPPQQLSMAPQQMPTNMYTPGRSTQNWPGLPSSSTSLSTPSMYQSATYSNEQLMTMPREQLWSLCNIDSTVNRMVCAGTAESNNFWYNRTMRRFGYDRTRNPSGYKLGGFDKNNDDWLVINFLLNAYDNIRRINPNTKKKFEFNNMFEITSHIRKNENKLDLVGSGIKEAPDMMAMRRAFRLNPGESFQLVTQYSGPVIR